MHTRTLRNFVAVATEGSISRAARKMNITQSALSQQLLNLEHEMGSELLSRSSNGVRLSSAGEILLQYAADILSLCDQVKTEIMSNQSHIRGDVSLAMSSSMADLLLPELLRRLHNDLPGLNLQLIESSSLGTVNLLQEARIDLGIIPDTTSGGMLLDCEPVLRMPLRFIGRIGAGFAAESSNGDIPFEEVLSYPLAVMSKHPSIKSLVQNAAKERGLGTEFVFESASASVVRAYVAGALACTIMPSSLVFPDESGKLFFARRIVDPVLERTYVIASPKARRPDRSTRALKAVLVDVLSGISEGSMGPG